jgi:TonB-like protein
MISLKNIFIYLIIIELLYSCSSSIHKPIFYSRDSISYDKIETLYNNYPVYQDSLIDKFIIKLVPPEYPYIARKAGATGTMYCQTLIDFQGKVEAIYVNYSINPSLDEAGIKAILKSKFRTHKEISGKKNKYSLLLPITFAMRINY